MVRDWLIALFPPERAPAAAVYLAAYLASRLGPRFHRGLTRDPAPFLDRIGRQFADPAYLERLLTAARRTTPAGLSLARLVYLVLTARLEHPNRTRFNNFCGQVLHGLEPDPKGGVPDERTLQALIDRYHAAEASLTTAVRERLDHHLRHFCLAYWYQDRLAGEDLQIHVRRLVLHLVVIRFLVVGHPRPGLDGPDWADHLDRLTVEAVQIYMKNLTHNREMMQTLLQAMAQLGFVRLDDLAALLRPGFTAE